MRWIQRILRPFTCLASEPSLLVVEFRGERPSVLRIGAPMRVNVVKMTKGKEFAILPKLQRRRCCHATRSLKTSGTSLRLETIAFPSIFLDNVVDPQGK